MNLTVCELPHDPDRLDEAWEGLVEHCRLNSSDVVLLPEMPFSVWLAATKEVDPERWDKAVASHEAWLERLGELGASTVLGSRPVVIDGHRHNEAFVWEPSSYQPSHHKYYLPDEDGFWEATWYDRGTGSFPALDTSPGKVGFLMCTEVWFTEHARELGRAGVVILATPRSTEWASRDKWLAGGRAAAVMSGAFGVSSNRSGTDVLGMRWGGLGWIIDPDGKVLATTSEDEPAATVTVDLLDAARAKVTYPRYVKE
ncbi:MAG: carbon-nitrogen hydrolase family protein [Acidimicrobiia bacterium]